MIKFKHTRTGLWQGRSLCCCYILIVLIVQHGTWNNRRKTACLFPSLTFILCLYVGFCFYSFCLWTNAWPLWCKHQLHRARWLSFLQVWPKLWTGKLREFVLWRGNMRDCFLAWLEVLWFGLWKARDLSHCSRSVSNCSRSTHRWR